MKYDNFIKKLQKRLGTKELDISCSEWRANGRKEWLVYEGTVATWRVSPNGRHDDTSTHQVSSFHTKGAGQESDSQTDYFPGTWWDNATQLIDRLKLPPPKYPAGSLVRGKDNKRAHRFGYAGKHALVIKATDARYLTLQFVGHAADAPSYAYNNFYSARDFELVS